MIADDLTGAAELAGVAWRHGLRAEVHTNLGAFRGAQMISVDTDSRQLAARAAARRVTWAAEQLQALSSAWIYKKVDSVMRGPVLAELQALRRALRFCRVLLVPANPSLGRIIKRGYYYVGGKLIHQKDFGRDPGHPRHSSRVLEMLGGPSALVTLRRPDQPLPSQGIIVGAATSLEYLRRWAERVDDTILPAGAAEFFTALLQARGCKTKTITPPDTANRSGQDRTLFVCGSASLATRRFLVQMRRLGIPVLSLPATLVNQMGPEDEPLSAWVKDIVNAFTHSETVVAAINQPLNGRMRTSERLSRQLITAVTQVLAKVRVDQVCIEGGATGTALLRAQGWSQLEVVGEFSSGVVALRPQIRRPI